MSIDGTERIVEQVDIRILIQCTSELYSLLLSATKIHALFANLGVVTKREHLDVLRK